MLKLSKLSQLHSGAALVALMACTLPHAAVAQEADEEVYTLDEIIVEARRRLENLLEVPVSATAVKSESLQRSRSHDLE
ncbi:MAG: hypothetical protein MJH10_19845, partial [Epibacterium sp.]|nr:hypothetical protein [Epibacterium sp.]NQX75734.1 hypothetical protein [Epibacterium sp.]